MNLTVERTQDGYIVTGKGVNALVEELGKLRGKGSKTFKDEIKKAVKQYEEGEQLTLLEEYSYNSESILSLDEIQEQVEWISSEILIDNLHGLDYTKELYNRLAAHEIVITNQLIDKVQFIQIKEALRVCLHYEKTNQWLTKEQLKREEYKQLINELERITDNQKEWIHNRLDQSHIIPLVLTMNSNGSLFFTCMNGKLDIPFAHTFQVYGDGTQRGHGKDYPVNEHEVLMIFNSCTNFKKTKVIDARERFARV